MFRRPGSRPGRSIQTAMPYSPFTTFKASMDLSDGTCRDIRRPGSRPGRFIQHRNGAGGIPYTFFIARCLQCRHGTVYLTGVRYLLTGSTPGCSISRPILVTVWIHFHNLSFSGFGLPFGVFMSSKKIRLAV